MTSTSSSIKECIAQLCRLLKYAPRPIIVSPDTFRQAKQDRPAVIDEMLIVVNTLISCFDQEHKAETKLDVLAHKLNVLGYPRVEVICNQASSKELLMCFGWLLHATKVLSEIFHAALQPTDIFSLLLREKFKDKTCAATYTGAKLDTGALESMFGPTLGPMQRHCKFESLTFSGKMNYLSWMFGKVQLKFNALVSIQLYVRKINAQIQRQTGNDVDKTMSQCLSADEVLMLKHPVLIHLCEKDMERKIQIIHSYQKWKQLESTFWQWLHSLLDSDEHVVSINTESLRTVSSSKELQEDLNKVTEAFDVLKQMLYESQREWLDLAKSDSDRLAKVRVEQGHQITKHVQVIMQHANDLEAQFKLYPLSEDVKKSSTHQVTLPITHELERLRAQALDVATQLHQMEQLCAEELTMIINTKLGEHAILVPATAIT